MSEEVQELEQEEVEANPILDFIDAIKKGDFNQSQSLFQDIMGDKVHSALEAEKVAVAQSIFNEPDEDLEDEEELDLDEVDLEDEEEEIEYEFSDDEEEETR